MKRQILFVLMCLMFSSIYAQKEIAADELTYQLLPKMSKPIVIDFWADWCGPCKRYAPIYNKVASNMKAKADFFRVNIDNNPDLSTAFDISSIPTTIVIYDKSCHYLVRSGLISQEELKAAIDEACRRMQRNQDEDFF